MNQNSRTRNRSNRGIPSHPPEVGVLAVPKGLSYGFPHQLLTKLRYHDALTLSSVGGSTAKYVFRTNSTFDPDLTGTGHQPLYRDTFAAIYNQYSVVSSIATIKMVNTSANLWLVGSVTEDDNASSSTASVLCEQANGQHTILPPQTGSLSSCTFIQKFDCVKQLGIDPYKSETYKTAVGSNPTEEADLVIWGADLAAGTTTIAFDIEIEFVVLWTELTSPISS